MAADVLCFGEVLWDVLPTGKLLGGAPFNVSFHLQQAGIDSKVISQIGNDPLGEEIRAAFDKWNIPTDYLFTHPSLPTSQVTVELDELGKATYVIHQPVAWDEILIPNLQELDIHVFVFGSLACRSPKTRETVLACKKKAAYTVFDINLRAPFFSKESIGELAFGVDFVKMNDEELELIAAWYFPGAEGIESQMKALSAHFGWETCLVTCGANGAYVLEEGEIHFVSSVPVKVADTIGSGDAFLAGFLAGKLKNYSVEKCLRKATILAAFITSRNGAIHEHSENVELDLD